jgi:cell division protein FtsQ
MEDAEDDDLPAKDAARPRRRFSTVNFGLKHGPWWKPSGTFGRALLGTCTVTVLGSLAVGAFFLERYLHQDDRFRVAGVSNIEAAGLSEVSRAELLPVFGSDIGKNIFKVSLSERRAQLEQIPWVEHATVMRMLPDRIRVNVVERKPVAFAREGDQFGMVDANGVLLNMPAAIMAQRHYSFPVVTGINAQDPLGARQARMRVYIRLLAELDANGQKLSEQVSEIDLSNPDDARVLMPEQGGDILAHFGGDHFMERYQRYKEHIAEWRQQYPKLSAVDLRYDQQVVLEMKSGEAASDTSAIAAVNDGTKVEAPAVTTEKSKATPGPTKHEKALKASAADKNSSASAPTAGKLVKASVETKQAKARTGNGKKSATRKAIKPGLKSKTKNIKSAKATKVARERAALKAKARKHAAAKVAALKTNRAPAPTHAAVVTGQ